MEIRTCKKSGERVSLLGFGCMRLPLMEGTQEIDVTLARSMVDRAISRGINYFDTAYPYHEKKSETFIGEALSRYPRRSFHLADKLPTWMLQSEGDVPKYFYEQLEKCRVDYFDYYLVHSINRERMDIFEANDVYAQLKEFQAKGKIRQLGFSFHDRPEVLAAMVQKYKWDFVQIQFNYLDWELQDAKSQYKILRDAGVQIVVMEPVRGGALATLCDEASSILKAANPGVSLASWALRYAGSFPEVLTILSGMSDMSQLDDNLSTMDAFRPVSPYEYEVINEAVAAYRLASPVPCTACRYCMDCPAGVDIPKVLAIYNNFRRKRGDDPIGRRQFDLEYGILGEQKHAGNCVKCGQCAPHCPQMIDIPAWMTTIDEFAKEGAA
jgi:predicted aldo/keto reductase-like oxidoreductase